MLTEGGFTASSSRAYLGVINPKIPGTNVDFPGGIASFAAPLLMWVFTQIHQHVEPAHAGWCWGWSYREVRGGGAMSDHSGAVAGDYNAPSHPRGVHGTWSSSEIYQIRGILAEANRDGVVIAWGHDFQTTVDDMHFACRGGRAAVIAAGKRLNTQTAPEEWDQVATKAEIRDVVDTALAAALPKIAAAAADAALAKLAKALDSDTDLRTAFRNNVRVPVDAELTQRHLGQE